MSLFRMWKCWDPQTLQWLVLGPCGLCWALADLRMGPGEAQASLHSHLPAHSKVLSSQLNLVPSQPPSHLGL